MVALQGPNMSKKPHFLNFWDDVGAASDFLLKIVIVYQIYVKIALIFEIRAFSKKFNEKCMIFAKFEKLLRNFGSETTEFCHFIAV